MFIHASADRVSVSAHAHIGQGRPLPGLNILATSANHQKDNSGKTLKQLLVHMHLFDKRFDLFFVFFSGFSAAKARVHETNFAVAID